ncbi:hypothetical protein K437DRAFT_276223 [Tilletiaria anomala UBC 951]|uniref:Sorting nexin/Vps5-like C-terminal domain-containing protein n=1 Tax=Tilletiaria anomala (strain ATCC 24038 / CBS 436.72 / UBC 951) TaxID=1037660 RepID=A0A066VA59_TILAU|nr:uncharacterized protein K437DRAFT_276223 [Tilletiaria anomala UBC 951]KDN38637.1 hypothetical protein K437DRAFT_276223 [Tilletiaria anomala UBC 951]
MIADTAAYRPSGSNEAHAYIKPPGGPADMIHSASGSNGTQIRSGEIFQGDSMASQQPQPQQQQPPQPVLDLRVITLEKGRRDLTFRLQAKTNLPYYRSNAYPSILRTYREIALLCLAMTLQHPSSIVQALPIPFPSLISASQVSQTTRTQAENAAIQHQEDIFLSQLQRWIHRTISDPMLLQSLELRSFIDSEYSYHPTAPDTASSSPALRKRFNAGVAALSSAGVSGAYGPVDVGSGSVLGLPSGAGTASTSATAAAKSIASSLFSSIGGSGGSAAGAMGFATSRSLHDEDDELVGAREEVTRLEMQFAQAAEGLEKLSMQRRSLLEATANLSARMTNLAAIEEIRPPSAKLGLPHALGCTGEMLRRVTELEEGQSRMEVLTLGDMLAYQSLNARSAKEAMLSRNALVEEHYNVTKLVASRKQAAENLRGSSTIRPEKVDEALQEYAGAREREREVAIHLQGVSQGLKSSLRRHSKFAHADLEDAVVAHGRDSLRRTRIMLDVIRGLKPEVRRAPQRGPIEPVQPIPTGTPSPAIARPVARQAPVSPLPPPQVVHTPVPQTPVPHVPADAVKPPNGIPAPVSIAATGSPTGAPTTNKDAAPSITPITPSHTIVAALSEPAPPPTPSKIDGVTVSAISSPPAQAARLPSLPSRDPSPTGFRPTPFAPMAQSMHQPASPSPFASMGSSSAAEGEPAANPFAFPSPSGSASGMARSMFVERPPNPQQQQQSQAVSNSFGTNGFGSASTINGGSLNSGRSRISARDAAKSLAGRF